MAPPGLASKSFCVVAVMAALSRFMLGPQTDGCTCGKGHSLDVPVVRHRARRGLLLAQSRCHKPNCLQCVLPEPLAVGMIYIYLPFAADSELVQCSTARYPG